MQLTRIFASMPLILHVSLEMNITLCSRLSRAQKSNATLPLLFPASKQDRNQEDERKACSA